MSKPLKFDGVFRDVGMDEFEPVGYTNFTLYTTEYIEDMECELPNGLKVAIYVEDGDYTSIDIILDELFSIMLHTRCTECNHDLTVQFPFLEQDFQNDRIVIEKATLPCKYCRKPQYKGFKFKVLGVK
jgi:hypothetical protein